MFEKISFADLLITVIPGGFLVSVVFMSLLFLSPSELPSLPDQDFLLTFVFLALSFTAGEVVQTLARLCEGLIDIFFKGYRPSELILLPNNPVTSERQIQRLVEHAKLSDADRKLLQDYRTLSLWRRIFRGKDACADLCQDVFRQTYTKHQSDERITGSNARYLFTRAMFVVFLLVAGWLLFLAIRFGHTEVYPYLVLSLLISLAFLHRARGCGRGLVRQVVYISLYS